MAERTPPLRVALLCGGRSEEHEVSLASARSVLEVSRADYDVTPVVIDRTGAMWPAVASAALLAGNLATTLGLPADGHSREAGHAGERAPVALAPGLQRLREAGYDVVFPLLHGPFGEDGSVQGLLKVIGLPFVGSDVLGSAVGMDKLMMKAVFASQGLPQVGFGAVGRREWREAPQEVLERLTGLRYPRFVKPANLGSSIGIQRVEDAPALAAAISAALTFDRRVIVEEGVVGARELEVGVLGNDTPRLSPVGEIRYHRGFYDYAAKYTDGQAELHIPAELPDGVIDRVHHLARQAFTAIDAAGLARVDFFYREADDLLVLNEINTMPGFTRHSMYPKLWEAGGLSYLELVGALLTLALEER